MDKLPKDFLGPEPTPLERRWARLEVLWEHTDTLLAQGRRGEDVYVDFFCAAWNLPIEDNKDHFDPYDWIPEDKNAWRCWWRRVRIRVRAWWANRGKLN